MQVHCPYDAMVSVKDLKPNPKNRNSHPDDQIERLAKILEYQGFRYPVKVSKQSGFIVSGHGRLLAAKKLGLSEVPVSFQDYESEEQEYADAISDNSIASWSELDLSGINTDVPDLGPDFDIDLLGIKDFVIEPAEKLEPGCDEDEVPESADTRCKLGDIWKLGNHRLMCGDSTSIDAVEKLMDGQRADLCFTSPPYSDQREYNGEKNLDTQHLSTFMRTSVGFVRYFVVNLGYARKNGEVFSYWDDYISEAKSVGLKFLSWNIWNREHPITIGQQTAMFPIEHEWVFVFGQSLGKLNSTKPNKHAGQETTSTNKGLNTGSKTYKVATHRALGTVLTMTSSKDKSVNHPAKFPVNFPESYIEAMTVSENLVYEPFAGSGSTAIACEKTNRKCFMMELDPKYCDVILARWEKYTGKTAELLNGEA